MKRIGTVAVSAIISTILFCTVSNGGAQGYYARSAQRTFIQTARATVEPGLPAFRTITLAQASVPQGVVLSRYSPLLNLLFPRNIVLDAMPLTPEEIAKAISEMSVGTDKARGEAIAKFKEFVNKKLKEGKAGKELSREDRLARCQYFLAVVKYLRFVLEYKGVDEAKKALKDEKAKAAKELGPIAMLADKLGFSLEKYIKEAQEDLSREKTEAESRKDAVAAQKIEAAQAALEEVRKLQKAPKPGINIDLEKAKVGIKLLEERIENKKKDLEKAQQDATGDGD